MTRSKVLAAACTAALLLTACGDDGADATPPETGVDGTADEGADADTAPDTVGLEVVAGEPFPEERCEANRAAGQITYLSGFDFSATASIIEPVVAAQSGYFEELCLDVELVPSFSTANYPLVAANEAQFASSGSFSELATQAEANEADLVALYVAGNVAVDVLMVKPDRAASLDELAGDTIGIKGALPPAVAVMLSQEAGLVEGDDYRTALLDGFDPFAHWAIDEIAALPGWRSNEPGALERGGETFDLYDPAGYGVPGSFGLIFTNRDFLDAHPTAAEDFMRATLRGLADAIADPDAAVAMSFELVEAGGNPNFLSVEGETFRWNTDIATMLDSVPEGEFLGVAVADLLASQVAAYDEVDYYADIGVPSTDGRADPLVRGLYDDTGDIIWPA